MALILIAGLFLLRNIIGLLYAKATTEITETMDTNINKELQKGHDLMSYSIILEKNPFGRPMKLRPLSAIDTASSGPAAPPSDLTLVGTAVGPEEMSYAILISKEDQVQEVFRYGDEVSGYGRLIEIRPEYVRIMRGGETITIRMVDIGSFTGRSKAEASGSKATFVKKIGDRDYILDRDRVQQLLENPEQILTDARLLPNFRNGRQYGFKLFEVRPAGLYESLGLRNGDILLKINGLDISSPDVAIKAMSALRGMDRISLDIMRGGSRLSLNYQIR
jgi:general secretion pathway protein C